MRIVTDLLLAGVDLVEAEVRALRAGTMKLIMAIGIFAVSLIFIIAAMALVLWGFYLLLAWAINPTASAFLTAAISLVLAIILAVIAKSLVK